MARMLAIATLAFAACSTLPPAQWPEFEERLVEAVWQVPADAPLRVRLPVSAELLTILELHSEPPVQTTFLADGSQFLIAPAGTGTLTVTCRYRAFGPRAQRPRPQDLFAGAEVTVRQ
jgi:hypothetical protein